jgi:hypothetical protein
MYSTIPPEVLLGFAEFVSYFFTILAVTVSFLLTGRT